MPGSSMPPEHRSRRRSSIFSKKNFRKNSRRSDSAPRKRQRNSGIAPGGNINYITGHAVFEATHGTAPKYANQDKVNPGSVILSGEMMFRYMGWTEAADLIIKGLKGAIASKRVTYDFARLMEDGTEIKCSEFGDNVIQHM